MKFTGIIILFICAMAASFSNWFIIFTYSINQNYIATTFCENKTKPAMHCNGHCYLSRQLAKEQAPTSPLSNKGSEKFEIQLFCNTLTALNTIDKTNTITAYNLHQNFASQQFVANNFHPPKA